MNFRWQFHRQFRAISFWRSNSCAASKSWPRYVYIRPTEQALRRSGAEGRDKDTKPVFIDLESYLLLEIFHRWLTKAGELEVTEMLPDPDHLLAGSGWTAHIRTADVDRAARMKIVAIANQKGGVGKTTTAVNLGCALAEQGQRILLIDLDPQGNATSSFGLQELEGESLYDPLLGSDSVADKILPTRLERLFIIPADLDLAGAEIEIARMDDHLTRLTKTLAPLREDDTFDFILLDCPPSLGILMTNALAAADELLTPIQCEFFALEGLVRIVRVVEQMRNSGANDHLEIARHCHDDVRWPHQFERAGGRRSARAFCRARL